MRKIIALVLVSVSMFVVACKKEIVPPVIKPVESNLSISYNSQSFQLVYSVSNQIQGESLKASSSSSWLSVVSVGEQIISLKAQENNDGKNREALLTLSYANAEDVIVKVTQAFVASELIFEPSHLSTNYTSKSSTFSFSINNAREGEGVKAESLDSWISIIEVGKSSISFNISENSTGKERKSGIKVTYGSLSKVFDITQSYTSSAISCEPASQSTDYTKKELFFAFSLSGEKEGAEMKAISQSDWISNVMVSNNTVKYMVSDNNSGTRREGVIKLTYADAVQEYRVTQEYTAAVITLSKESDNMNCLPGDYSFDYTLSNMHDGVNISSNCDSDWISNIKINDGKVTYSISQNTSKADRTGNITLIYGNVSKSFSIHQTYPIISISPSTTRTDHFAKDITVKITVSNPVPEGSFICQPNTSWFTYKDMKEEDFTFHVQTNNSGKEREGKYTIMYCNLDKREYYSSIEYIIVQGEQAEDLSISGTANCYVAGPNGKYMFVPTEGNTKTRLSGIVSVEVLWESFGTSSAPEAGDLIRRAEYSNGYITFETSDKEGNALIAAKDASGEIVWSWHIWRSILPQLENYKNGAGEMLSCNLGSVTTASKSDVRYGGLLYQWGRKDPFLGADNKSSNTRAASTGSWPEAVTSNQSTGTINYSTKNPMTFIAANNSNNDWYYTGSESVDNSRWGINKTKYDPCPAGYKLPTGGFNGFWFKAANGYNFNAKWDDSNKGCSISGITISGECWYPACGAYSSKGRLQNVGTEGYIWSVSDATSDANKASIFWVNKSGADCGFFSTRADGLSVRCVKE